MTGTAGTDTRWALVHEVVADGSLLGPPAPDLATVLAGRRRDTDGPRSEVSGPLVVPAELVPALLEVVRPDDDLPVVLASLGPSAGLGPLSAARDALLDQPWLRPVGAWLDVVPDSVATATRLTLDALDLTVPTALFLPAAAGWGELLPALDVIAEDGVERAGWHLGPAADDADAAARFLVACHERRLTTVLTSPPERLTGLLTAALVAADGGDVADVGAAMGSDRLPAPEPAVVRRGRRLLTQVGVPEGRTAVDALLAELAETGASGGA